MRLLSELRGIVYATLGALVGALAMLQMQAVLEPEVVHARDFNAPYRPSVSPAELEHVKSLLPDQSAVMSEVEYHFANLWFAGLKQNWPLAGFCLHETEEHLEWAVRIRPVRKLEDGAEVDLKAIFESVANTSLAALDRAIEARDPARFQQAYHQTLEGCYACHKASGKPYLRPSLPAAPAAKMLNFDPDATWPQ